MVDRWLRPALASGLAVVVAVAAALSVAGSATAQGGASVGQALYEARCGACHSIDHDRIGPHHRGIVGRRAGTAVGFAYSPALRRFGQLWTPALLDRWLTNPRALVPGTRMGLMTANPADRQAIIAYLATQRAASPAPR